MQLRLERISAEILVEGNVAKDGVVENPDLDQGDRGQDHQDRVECNVKCSDAVGEAEKKKKNKKKGNFKRVFALNSPASCVDHKAEDGIDGQGDSVESDEDC